MDFFEHQDVARRNIGRLLLLFGAAVGAIVLMLYVLVLAILVFRFDSPAQTLWLPRVFGQCATAVLTVICAGSLWKIRQLGQGGGALAERVGGRRVDPASTDELERRVLNVVEEMAIASGTPVPPVYLLDRERAINAFAAGHDASDAVIGVTRGAVEVLTRDELQGVVAHEFSHVLHGDMGLNLQLIGAVHGIEMIGAAGRLLAYGGPLKIGRAKKGGGGAALLGGALMLIGGVGSLFGRVIRAAVSKQREFLADASAVQFTRNPQGVADALRKIGGFGFGSHLSHPGRAELSHMFFGSGLPAWDLSDLFGTHPPLEQRIRRVDPSFDGTFPVVPLELVARWEGEEEVPRRRGGDMAAAVAHFATASLPPARRRGVKEGGVPHPHMAVRVTDTAAAPSAASFRRPAPKPLLERLGDPGPEHLAHTRALLASVPTTLKDAARDLPQARALVYALLASPRADVWELQARTIERADGREALGHATAFRGELARVDARVRIPLSEVLTGTLGNLDSRVYDAFRRTVIQLAEADGELDLHEWILSGLVLRYLDGRFGRRRQARARYSRLSGLEREIACVLSVLAHSGSGDSEAARKAFGKAASELRLDAGHMTSPEGTGPRVLEAALATLAELVPQQKKRFLAACATAIAADGRVASREAELFCVIAIWLDCPAPPLLPDQRLV